MRSSLLVSSSATRSARATCNRGSEATNKEHAANGEPRKKFPRRVVEAARGKNERNERARQTEGERERERERTIASLSYFITFTRSAGAVYTEPRSRLDRRSSRTVSISAIRAHATNGSRIAQRHVRVILIDPARVAEKQKERSQIEKRRRIAWSPDECRIRKGYVCHSLSSWVP